MGMAPDPSPVAFCTVLAVKPFDAAKGRLAAKTSSDERARIARHLYHRTAALVAECKLEPVVVVTRDADAALEATTRGWTVLAETGHSHSEAIQQAAVWGANHGHRTLFALSCDLPLLGAYDVRRMTRLVGPNRLIIAPDRLGQGTNALIVSPPDAIAFHFGPDSLRKHMASARNTGLHIHLVRTPGLAVDLDEAWDLDLADLRN